MDSLRGGWNSCRNSTLFEVIQRKGIKHQNAHVLSQRPCNQCQRTQSECTIVETTPTLPHKLITSLANFSNSDQALATYTSQPLYV